jgi:hypothetical protein
MRAGDVFRFTNIADIHVWMIISDPGRDASKVLMVSFTTWQPYLDQACVLEAGDHPFVVHKTVVNYARAKVVTDAQLESLRRAGRLQPLEALSPQLLARIRRCAMQSVTLPIDCADILEDQELID